MLGYMKKDNGGCKWNEVANSNLKTEYDPMLSKWAQHNHKGP